MWQRLQIALCLCWTPLRVGTAMETTVCPASLPRASPAMVGINLNMLLELLDSSLDTGTDLLQKIVCLISDFYGVHFLSAYLSVPNFTPRSAGVSGCVRSSCEEEGRVPESSVKDHRDPFPRHPSLPSGFRARCHSSSQTPGHSETEKARLPLQTFPSFGSACHFYT